MKAIEQGVITSTTRDRLIELEAQQSDLSAKLNSAKEDLVHVDRKNLISSLLLFRNGMFTTVSIRKTFSTHFWSQPMFTMMATD